MMRIHILWALSLGLFLVLANTTTALAQSEDCGDQTCIYLPAVINTDLAAPSRPDQLVRALAQAPTEAARREALLAIMQALHIGVYTAEGEALLRGAERAPGDFYLYDFELDSLATSLAEGEEWSLADVTRLLEQMGLFAEGAQLSPLELHEVLRDGVRSARENPNDRLSLIPLLVRELGLQHPVPYDLGEEVSTENLHFDALQRWLIVADILLPLIWAEGPVTGVSAASMGPTAGTGCSDIGGLVIEQWHAGKWALSLVLKAGPVTFRVASGIDTLHGMILAYGVEVRALASRVQTHYGHETPGQEIQFRISVRMRDKLPDTVVECGWILGVIFPPPGPIPGVYVEWTQAKGDLNQHGEIRCGSPCSTKTDAQGIATVVFQPKSETQPGVGMVVEEAGLVDSLVLYQSVHKNMLGTFAQHIIPKTFSIRWFVEYHQSDTWSGRVTITQAGEETQQTMQPGYTGSTTKRASYEATLEVTGVENYGAWGAHFRADLTQKGQATIQGQQRKEVYDSCTAGQDPFLRAVFEDSVDGSYSGTAQGQTYIRVTVKSDGSYELITGALGLTAQGSKSAHNVFWDTCQPAWDYDRTQTDSSPIYLSPYPVRVTGQVDPAHPDRFAGSYTTSVISLWQIPTTVTIQWDLTKQ